MTLKIKHLYKDEDKEWNCQVSIFHDVRFIESEKYEGGEIVLQIYYTTNKSPDYVDLYNCDDCFDLIECLTDIK